VDVGGFAEPRKILCQCALPSVEQLSVHLRSAHGVPEFPNNHLVEDPMQRIWMHHLIILENMLDMFDDSVLIMIIPSIPFMKIIIRTSLIMRITSMTCEHFY
jgi:hypothetical protein